MKWRKSIILIVVSVFIIVILVMKSSRTTSQTKLQVPDDFSSYLLKNSKRMRDELLPKSEGSMRSNLHLGYLGQRTSLSDTQQKIVLYYNLPNYLHIPNDHTPFEGCNISECVFSSDNEKLESSSAVIFNHQTIPSLPPPKKVGQVWIFTSSESPTNTQETVRKKEWNAKFNWTMSYRRHSDFYFGYGDIYPRKKVIERDYKMIYKQKDRDVVWIVSHCTTHSRREDYVKEMQKYVSIDIYGKCGDKNCDVYKGNENDSCHEVISRKYKFYLSFENTICKDYTTEKFYFPFTFDKPIVPVARGAFNLKDYVPPDAYVDAANFTSPKQLARYLARVASDEEEYLRVLKLKDKYLSKTSPETFKESMCAICASLHENRPAKVIDVNDVIFDNQCKDHRDVFNRKQPIMSIDVANFKNIVSKLKDNLT